MSVNLLRFCDTYSKQGKETATLYKEEIILNQDQKVQKHREKVRLNPLHISYPK